MILTAGKPASLQRAANLYKGKGVISEVFITTIKHICLNHLCPLILSICHKNTNAHAHVCSSSYFSLSILTAVTGGQGGGELPSGHHSGVVPRNNSTNNTESLMTGISPSVMSGINGFTVNLICPTGEVTETSDRISNINITSNDEGLSIIESIQSSNLLDIAFHQVGELVNQTATLSRSNLAPSRVEAIISSLNSSINIALVGRVDRTDDLFSSRVNGFNKWAITRNKFIVDKKLGVN